MMRRGTIDITDDMAEKITGKSFELLIDPETDVAIRVWQIEILLDMRKRFEWLGANLTDLVRAMSEKTDCTMGAAAAARKYFRRIAKTGK